MTLEQKIIKVSIEERDKQMAKYKQKNGKIQLDAIEVENIIYEMIFIGLDLCTRAVKNEFDRE